jgi:hypothetical protein
MLLMLAFSYTRGLAMFYLLTPIIFARPVAECATWCAKAPQERANIVGSDPVLKYLQKRSTMTTIICLAFSTFITAVSWRQIGIGPPSSVMPKSALEFVSRAGIKGNVFNSYDFGGALIFLGIPTFIDSRQPPYTDDFFREEFNAEAVADKTGAFQLLDRYEVEWAILKPTVALPRVLVESKKWDEVYSDNNAIVLVRHR